MIRIAVCDDDETYILKTIKPLLSRAQKTVGVVTETRFFTDGNLLLDELESHQDYSIVILDIDMPSINGKDLAARLRELDKNLYIAFISAYKEEVYDVISLNISAFIPKEYDKSKCLDDLIKLLKKFMNDRPEQKLFSIIDKGRSAIIKLCLDNILYIKMIRNTVVIYTENEELVSTERSLKSLENELVPFGFYKTFSNTLVNVGKVYEVLDTEVILNDKTHLPISRRRRKDLLIILSRIISAKVVT